MDTATPPDYCSRPCAAGRIALKSQASGLHWLCTPILLEEQWLAWCDRILSDDEKRRAANYAFDWLSARYRAGRGALRHAIGEFTGTAPALLAFRRGTQGKPYLADGACAFNFSDSGNYWAVCMHADAGVALGIDIEEVTRFANAGPGLRNTVLSAAERAAWQCCAPARAATALATVWTRKEALLKALGTGLSTPLAGFSVGWEPGANAIELAGRRWHLQDLPDLPQGLAGCVAVNIERD